MQFISHLTKDQGGPQGARALCGRTVKVSKIGQRLMKNPFIRKHYRRLVPFIPVCQKCVLAQHSRYVSALKATDSAIHDYDVAARCLVAITEKVVKDETVPNEVREAVLDLSNSMVRELSYMDGVGTPTPPNGPILVTGPEDLAKLPPEVREFIESMFGGKDKR